jgi:hypothetical protein
MHWRSRAAKSCCSRKTTSPRPTSIDAAKQRSDNVKDWWCTHARALKKRPFKTVTMAKATLANGQLLHAVNDLFIGARSHTSAIYEITAGERKETQSSSGLIVSTGLGSRAWFKSIVTGSLAIAGAAQQPN